MRQKYQLQQRLTSKSMLKAAIIMAPDDTGAMPVFGIPAARRLTLLAQTQGIEKVYVISRTDALQALLADLIPPTSFYRIETSCLPDRMMADMHLSGEDRVVVLHAGLIIDRRSFKTFLKRGRRFRFVDHSHPGPKWAGRSFYLKFRPTAGSFSLHLVAIVNAAPRIQSRSSHQF
jgi:hypothetical protein